MWCSQSTLWRPEEGVTCKRKKGENGEDLPVSLEAGSKMNLTTCFHQRALKNGHSIQFETPRNPIDVSQHPQIMLLLHSPKVLISKLSTYFLNSLGELNAEALCVCLHCHVYRNTCVCVGMHVDGGRQSSRATQYFESL